jgi:hypothetical protein
LLIELESMSMWIFFDLGANETNLEFDAGLREAGETCSKHRVARLMRLNNLRALHGYRTRRWSVGKPSTHRFRLAGHVNSSRSDAYWQPSEGLPTSTWAMKPGSTASKGSGNGP